MGKVLVIGAGGVGTVVVHKMAALPSVFTNIMLASRTKSKCDAIARKIGGNRIQTAKVDADDVPQLVALIRTFKPDLVVNVALPYQDLPIMDACLETETSYLDTANYEPGMKPNLNINGSGPISKGSAKPASPPSWDVDLTRVLPVFSLPMLPNTILMRSTISILWTAMPATMAKPLPPTSTPKSTSGKSPRKENTTKMASGSKLNPTRSTRPSIIPESGLKSRI